MIHSGLVSITFRQLAPHEIVALVQRAGLQGIEWGGDVHAPHGDVPRAQAVRQMTVDAGLEVAAYGSYYRVGHTETGPFDAVLESAVALGAPMIRVWAGKQGSDSADEAYWAQVVEDSRCIAEQAAEEDIRIVYEYHANTLTDTNASARQLLERVDHDNVKTYWQPPRYSKRDDNLTGLELILPWMWGVHTFHWHGQTGERQPLAVGEGDWLAYLQKAAAVPRDFYALIEFVVDDEPDSFLRDAEALKTWLTTVNAALA